MKSKKIYLIRHGQTDYNLKGIVQGSGIDASINSHGKEQALAFFEAYGHIPFDKIYTSGLKRTIESVRSFIDQGIPYEQLPGLNEINWGTREGIVITPEEDSYYHKVMTRWQNGETDLEIEGGESPQMVFDRQAPILRYILERTNENVVLICMHGRAIRILLCQMLHYPLRSMDIFEHSNLCLYLLDFTGTMFTVERFSDTGHLRELVTI